MPVQFSAFSKWALDDARTSDERFLIFHVCEACRLLEYLQRPVEERRTVFFKHLPHHRWKEFYLNPLLLPEYGPEDTERATAMSPHLKKFSPQGGGGHETRRFGDAGAVFRFFPALEELSLHSTSMRDLSFLEALPNLRTLQMHSGVLEDFEPFQAARSLRSLSLSLSGSGPPLFTPPLYWVDARPLGALRELEHLAFSPNPAVLAGLEFPVLTSAEFENANCVQADCEHLPAMPALRRLKLSGVQSLRGMSRFPEMRHLRLGGPVRDFEEIDSLTQLDCLEVDTQDGWPRDVTPLTKLKELLWVRFGGEIPRNYWPLAQSPQLRQLDVAKVPAVHLEVQAVNAALGSWDDIFAASVLRPVPPLRFVAVEIDGDTSVLPRHGMERGQEHLAHPMRFYLEVEWMRKRVLKGVRDLLGDEDAVDSLYSSGPESTWDRHLSFAVQSIDVVSRFPEILDAFRRAMAGSPHEWIFTVTVDLKIKESEMDEQRKKWLKQIEDDRSRWDDDRSVEIYRKTQNHIIETQFRKRLSEEEGEEVDPEDFEPPEEIRPEPFHGVLLPARGGTDDEQDEEEENPDFQLKPFDEQEQNDGDDENDDGDDTVKTAPPPDPPPSFWDDPHAHPLASSYRFYATLTFDTIYQHGNNLATLMQLMRRGPDVIYPKRDKGV